MCQSRLKENDFPQHKPVIEVGKTVPVLPRYSPLFEIVFGGGAGGLGAVRELAHFEHWHRLYITHDISHIFGLVYPAYQ